MYVNCGLNVTTLSVFIEVCVGTVLIAKYEEKKCGLFLFVVWENKARLLKN